MVKKNKSYLERINGSTEWILAPFDEIKKAFDFMADFLFYFYGIRSHYCSKEERETGKMNRSEVLIPCYTLPPIDYEEKGEAESVSC